MYNGLRVLLSEQKTSVSEKVQRNVLLLPFQLLFFKGVPSRQKGFAAWKDFEQRRKQKLSSFIVIFFMHGDRSSSNFYEDFLRKSLVRHFIKK